MILGRISDFQFAGYFDQSTGIGIKKVNKRLEATARCQRVGADGEGRASPQTFGLPQFAAANRAGFFLLCCGDFPPAFREVAVKEVLFVGADFERLGVREDRDVAAMPRVAFPHHDV